MKIVVIEDEMLIAEDLIDILTRLLPDSEILAHLSSVQEGVDFFKTSDASVDLIFSDIQLGDGLSFEIFKETNPKAPVVFCTAYDEYAIDAFKVKGIDYILKPFSDNSILEAIANYNQLKVTFEQGSDAVKDAAEEVSAKAASHSTILVFHREKIIPLQVKDIAFAYIRNESIYLRTFDGNNYFINKSLDELEHTLGGSFYRANRQFLVSKEAVQDVTTIASRKYAVNLKIPFNQQITVSKEKMTSFLRWLKNEN